MDRVWARFVLILIALALVSLIAWPIAGPLVAMTVFATGLFAVVVVQSRHISLLRRWLRDPAPDKVPQGWGIWDRVFADLYRMLRRQHRSESRLSATLEDFRQAGAAMPDGMVILDAQDRIEWCNPVAERHFGLDRQRDTGQSIAYLVRQPQFVEYLQAQNYGDLLVLRQSRGSDFILSVQLVPYGDRQKLVISRDITDLERVETMRRDFIANVSHELRTPLTVLGGFLETILDLKAADSELLRRSLPLMMDQTQRMRRLVEDLLTLSRLESTHNPPREEPVNVPGLAREIYHDALAFSGGRHRVALDLAAGDWLTASEEELRSAFGNLISNAVRYTPEGGEVTIAWQRRGPEAAFSVRDTGIGIASQHLPRLTERFYRVDRSRSRETGGTGLGLAIVKHVLNRHQARLEIASEPGRGSTFSAVFPAERLLAPPERVPVALSA
ncbi:MAG: phosphate regulon sensor histidine kinase PhoR [Betaproteobacteria bacterium]|nr:phosphate regulon sensor histidine kinase PhoR [Betaproteobacteria bacterium]